MYHVLHLVGSDWVLAFWGTKDDVNGYLKSATDKKATNWRVCLMTTEYPVKSAPGAEEFYVG